MCEEIDSRRFVLGSAVERERVDAGIVVVMLINVRLLLGLEGR